MRCDSDDAEVSITHHGILPHQDNAIAAKAVTNLVHLLRADIVDEDDEDGSVLLQQILELVKVRRLVVGPAPHGFLDEARIFKGQVLEVPR